jgi:RNA polymerase sigma-70 factor (ECF subfamily)
VNHSELSTHDLVRACAQTNETLAWNEFVSRFHKLIAGVALRTARRWGDAPPELLDELIQETYLKLCASNCRLLNTFQAQQPEAFYGFLKVVTANVVHDYLKSAHATKRGSGTAGENLQAAELQPQIGAQPTTSTESSIERQILMREIDQHLAKSVTANDLPRSRLIFWLYYRSGLTASAIAALPHVGLSPSGVESAIGRLTKLVKAALSEPRDPAAECQSSKGKKGFREAESF